MSQYFRRKGEKESSVNEMVSKRLVDYFLTLTCEVKPRTDDSSDTASEDSAPPPPPTSPSRGLIDANDRRASTRAIHLSLTADGGIIGNSSSMASEQDSAAGLLNEVTPLVTNRKMVTDKNLKGNVSAINPDQKERAIAADFRSVRIPATQVSNGQSSHLSSEESDVEQNSSTNNDTTNKKQEEQKQPSKGAKTVVTPTKQKKNKPSDQEEDVLTPSRLRAMDSDSDGEETGHSRMESEVSSLYQEAKTDPNLAHHRHNDSENIQLPTSNILEETEDPLEKRFELQPFISAQYPLEDHAEMPLNPMVSHFCFPQTPTLTTEFQMPRIHYFVLTNEKGNKVYGTCLTVYEEFDFDEDSEVGREIEDCLREKKMDDINTSLEEQDIEVSLSSIRKIVYAPKVLCIMSSWPYLHSFREYLGQLYRLATMTDLMDAPIEKYIMNICEEAPAPPPGVFELQIKILNSTLKFWSPPGNQPIAYVALPFKVLFECLDLNNVIFVWYALTLERKVLLVSSKCSLLTTCAEILCSLLFPFEWSHIYVPILPMFLSPMLDAPVPYLCGITRENLAHAVNDINDETIVVDLDQNLITMGDATPAFPPLPLKRRTKLEKALQTHVGDVFWQARGISKSEVLANDGGDKSSVKLMLTADRVWKEKLSGYDNAFNLAFTPDSETLLNGDTRGDSREGDLKQSAWDAVQEAFLRFYASMMRDYSKFVFIPRKGKKDFKREQFVASQRLDYRYFLQEFTDTQSFNCFITKCMFQPKSPDLIFFNQSIAAKKNRSKMTIKKRETAFLLSAKIHRNLRKVEVEQPAPIFTESSNLLDQVFASSPSKKFIYKEWPNTFDTKHFGKPRPIPSAIAAEFARMEDISNSFKIGHSSEMLEDDDFNPTGTQYPSIEVATFTLFFTLYCKTAGLELEIMRNKIRNSITQDEITSRIQRSVESKIEESANSRNNLIPNCATSICSPCSNGNSSTFVSSAETVAIIQPLKKLSNEFNQIQLEDQGVVVEDENVIGQDEIEAAQLVAMRQLDLAFSVLDVKNRRGLPADQDALRSLMEACGRCGSTTRATQLISLMKEQFLTIDSEIYSSYLTTFTVANAVDPDDVIVSPLANVPMRSFDPSVVKVERTKWFGKGKLSKTKHESSSERSSDRSSIIGGSETSSSVDLKSETSSVSPRKFGRPVSRQPLQKKPEELISNDTIDRYITVGEFLLEKDLFGGIEIEEGDHCPQCSALLNVDQIMGGWNTCSFTDYNTTCPHCRNKFIPRFVVNAKSKDFVGTHGEGTPLYCEFFSPWVLRREIFIATNGGENLSAILDPNELRKQDFNVKLWFNIMVHFRRQKLPLTFLLQGHFDGTSLLL